MQSTSETISPVRPPEGQPDEKPGIVALGRGYLLTLATGWWSVARSLLNSVQSLAAGLSLVEWVFLLGCLGVIATTLLFPWIIYNVDLLAPEVAGRGSNYRLLFFLPGPLGILLYAINGRLRLPLFYTIAGLAAALFLAGILWANPVHTLMQDARDYRFHPALYAYGAALGIALATAWRALQGSLVSLEAVRDYLLEPRSPDEDLNSPQTSEAGRV